MKEISLLIGDLIIKFNKALECARTLGKEEGEAISIPPGDAVADARGEYDQARYDFEDAMRTLDKAIGNRKPEGMNPLLKLFARAIGVAEEFGSAGRAWEANPNKETKAYLEECRTDNLEAQNFYLEELKKVLPASPRTMLEVIVLARHEYGDQVMASVAEEVPGKDMVTSLNDTLMISKDGKYYRLGLAILPASAEYVAWLDASGICTHTRENTCHHCLEE